LIRPSSKNSPVWGKGMTYHRPRADFVPPIPSEPGRKRGPNRWFNCDSMVKSSDMFTIIRYGTHTGGTVVNEISDL